MKLDTSKKLSEVLQDVLRSDGTAKKMLEHRAEALWLNVMGPTVNRHTTSVRERDGIMYVSISSSVVRQEVFYLRGKIIATINKAVGEDIVKEIRLS